ncbi:DODA-type extradiol aromatic ring-opening family dioxygenase [Thiolapillus brandeum]|uniref:Extradiol ring-cleavage dioxygenase class III enzyme subunit B domain-containing protein n=1 Tax=Thiolapillus brandeum TaxID=1076588 RepID=A0A7U6GHT6_9GAMM|nr:class III extradiol ring-cleavage dioxygenase [Thiolapillus brandeum]BAO43858.1 conserved hypothetical protein [Thiolapillus brandeum]
MTDSMPVLFVAHGAPNILLQKDPVITEWQAVASALPRPERILMVSAHWDMPRHRIGGNRERQTIHDFRGFPEPLYEYTYAPPADVEYAEVLAAGLGLEIDHERGLDHGAWVPLLAMYPQADIPVTQLSVSSQLGPAAHLKLGRALAPLREQGVLILASGVVVHNLRRLDWQNPHSEPEPWAALFMGEVDARVRQGAWEDLIEPQRLPGGDLAVPTPEHYLPLLVAGGAAGKGTVLPFAHEWRYRNLSQHSYRFD